MGGELKQLIVIATLIWATAGPAFARAYFSYQAGYSGFRTEEMKEADVALRGLGHRFAMGLEVRNFDLELFYRKGDLSGDIKPNGTVTTLEAENASYGALLAFYLGNRLNLNLGYAWNENKYKIPERNPSTLNGTISPLGVSNEDGSTGGIIWGVGYDILKSRHIDLFAKYLNHSWSDLSASEHIVSIGLKFKFRFNIGNLFGARSKQQ